MKAFGALFAYCTAVVVQVALATSNVIDLTPANFDDVVLKSGKPALVEFFAVRPNSPPSPLLSAFVVLTLTFLCSPGADVGFHSPPPPHPSPKIPQ